jgi:hypothetical protein
MLGLFALATALLGLEKVGLFEVMPGGDVRFSWSASTAPASQTVTMRSDAGDLSCWLELQVPHDASDGPAYAATLGGEALAIATSPPSSGLVRLEISKPGAPAKTKFTWNAGMPLVLTHAGPRVRPLELHDWIVHQEKGRHDSAGNARQRRAWTVLSWLALVVSLVGVVFTASARASEPTATPAELVRRIVGVTVDGVVGKDDAETKGIRSYLRQVVLEGITAAEAMNALKIPLTPTYVRLGFHARATSLFKARITLVNDELNTFVAKLP